MHESTKRRELQMQWVRELTPDGERLRLIWIPRERPEARPATVQVHVLVRQRVA